MDVLLYFPRILPIRLWRFVKASNWSSGASSAGNSNGSRCDMPIFGLFDNNNFYASCEKLFNPRLKDLPVVVLSNNDLNGRKC